MTKSMEAVMYLELTADELDKLNGEVNTLAVGDNNTLLLADSVREAGFDIGDWDRDVIAYC